MTVLYSLLLICSLFAIFSSSSSYEIPVPYYARPESLAHAGNGIFYTADMLSGDVLKLDINTNQMTLHAKAPPGAGALGTYFSHGLIFVAGAGAPRVSGDYPALYVYHQFGGLITACHIPNGGMINDVTTDGSDYAYWTDSFAPYLYKMNLHALPSCEIEAIKLPTVAFTIGPTRRDMSNGIVYYNNGVIITHTVYETFYYVDFLKNNTATPLLPFHAVTHADGMLLEKEADGSDTLWLAEPRDMQITKWKLTMTPDRRVIPTKVAKITSPEFHNPTSPAFVGKTLLASNIDFRVPFHPPAGYTFYITVLPNYEQFQSQP